MNNLDSKNIFGDKMIESFWEEQNKTPESNYCITCGNEINWAMLICNNCLTSQLSFESINTLSSNNNSKFFKAIIDT